MKLRCTKNSIRIRIRKSELNQLTKDKKVEEKIRFGNQTVLTFALQISELTQQVNASLSNNQLVINLPIPIANQWINSSQVGIEVNRVVSKEHHLHILIEKDFPCLDRPEEDKSDTFWELAPDEPEAC